MTRAARAEGVRALLAAAVLVAAAGCFGDDGASPPTPATIATPTPATAPTMEPSPTPPTEPTPPTAEGPEPVAPKVVANQTFDFNTEGDATGQSPKTRPTSAVPEEHGNVTVEIRIVRHSAAPTPLPVSGSVNTPTVRVFAADGAEVLALMGEGEATATVPAVPGAWSVQYEGAGTMRAQVVVTAIA